MNDYPEKWDRESDLPARESNIVYMVGWLIIAAITISSIIGLYFCIKAM